MSDYETDIVLWSEHQAALLRRRAVGELLTTRTWTGRTSPRRSRPWAGANEELGLVPLHSGFDRLPKRLRFPGFTARPNSRFGW